MSPADEPIIAEKDACVAAGINMRTLNAWRRRNLVPMTHLDRLTREAGYTGYLSYLAVLQLCVMADLVRVGLPAKRAANVVHVVHPSDSAAILTLDSDGLAPAFNLSGVRQKIRSVCGLDWKPCASSA